MDERKSRTLFVRNLPFKATNESLEKVFSDVGPLKQCFVVKNKDDDQCKGYGYVTFSLIEDAEKAKSIVSSIDGRKLYISYANKKKDTKVKKSLMHGRPIKEEKSEESDSENGQTDERATQQVEIKVEKHIKEEKTEDHNNDQAKSAEKDNVFLKPKTLVVTGFDEDSKVDKTLKKLNLKNIAKIEHPIKGRSETTAFIRFKSIKDLKKGETKVTKSGLKAIQLSQEGRIKTESQRSNKNGRLIIRNLAFMCSENHLKEVFSKFGEVSEVSIPKKPDGKLMGFGFVQFTDVAAADKALNKMNSQMIRGRTVAVDWAVPKNQYQEAVQSQSDGESSSSEEDNSDEDKESEDEGSEESDEESEESDDSSDNDEDEDDSNDEDDSTDEGFEDSSSPKSSKQKKKKSSEDVEDGRTLFIRNLSFEAEEDKLYEALTRFGFVKYAKIVIDQKTGRPKGTGFVQFRDKTGAEACLEFADDKGPGVILDGRKLLITTAVTREKATGFEKKEKPKQDKRNLHLVREGLIRAGTKEAEGLTKEDISRRQKIVDSKRIRLKNPNIFVSTTRLCIHNLPKSLEDKELKEMFQKAAGKKARINECRIMRDTANTNTKGVAKSRGYGFINFSDHDHAIQALRNTNNNPDLFKDNRRLIVEFSLENKNALIAKEKRLERFQTRQKHLKQVKETENPTAKGKPQSDNDNTKNSRKKNKKQKDKITDRYIGNIELPAGTKKTKNILPSHWGPKIRHKPRPEEQQQSKKAWPEKRKFQSDEKPVKQKKRKKKNTVDDFDKLVNSYKQKIMSSKSSSKWFES